MKTYKQLADELGVTKDQIKYRASLLPDEYLVKQNGITYLTDTAIIRIKDTVGSKHTRVLTREGFSIVTQLQKEIEAKNRQIKDKDKHITELIAAITEANQATVIALQSAAAAQALHAGTMKQLMDNESAPPGLFSRLFGRNSKNKSSGVNE